MTGSGLVAQHLGFYPQILTSSAGVWCAMAISYVLSQHTGRMPHWSTTNSRLSDSGHSNPES